MAEVKKKFSELDPASVPFEGTETLAAVQGGITKRATISGIHGAGWWEKLKAAFVDFVAPEALHANDADTIGGETSAELHNAGALTGVAPLSVIPAELTGKNADTIGGETSAELHNAGALTGVAPLSVIPAELTGKNAETATKLKTARTITITGDATGSTTFDGSENKTITLSVTKAPSATSADRMSFVSPPATMSSSGTVGQFAIGTKSAEGYTAYFLYVCVANNLWRSATLTTF